MKRDETTDELTAREFAEGDRYTFVEFHGDTGEAHGTAKPLEKRDDCENSDFETLKKLEETDE